MGFFVDDDICELSNKVDWILKHSARSLCGKYVKCNNGIEGYVAYAEGSNVVINSSDNKKHKLPVVDVAEVDI